MNDYEIVERLSKTEKPRVTLYISRPKIEQFYSYSVSLVTEYIRSEKDTGRISGNLFGFVGSDVSIEDALSSKIVIPLDIKGVLLENTFRKKGDLIDLSDGLPKDEKLLFYVGSGQMTLMDEDVTQDKIGLAHEEITLERNKQKKVLQFQDDSIGTIVFTFQVSGKTFASIASTEYVDFGNLASYSGSSEFGIVSRLEKISTNTTFLSPIWIWSERM